MRQSNIRNGIWMKVLLTLLILLSCSFMANAEEILSVEAGTNLGGVLPGVRVYAFTETGVYTGKNGTNENGQVSFNLPGMSYKVRADVLGQKRSTHFCSN